MRHCYVLRVFTRGEDGGNHLGVVTDVSGLPGQTMQQIAADLGFSETVFIDWREGGVPAARIFTPAVEMAFAGHPLVGAGWVLLVMGPGGPDRISCGIGEIGLRLEGEKVWIDAPSERPVGPDVAQRPDWVTTVDRTIVEMPSPYLLAEVSTPEEVASAAAPPEGWGDAVMLWSWREAERSVKARFFAGGLGVVEDPATGSAAVALASLLAARGLRSGAVTVSQGDEIGHPSTIHLEWAPGTISVGGTVVKDRVLELEK